KLDGETRVQPRIHQLQSPTLVRFRESTANTRWLWLLNAGMDRELLTQSRRQCLDESQTAWIPRIGLGDERAEYVVDLRFGDAVSAAQLHRRFARLCSELIEVERIDRHPHVPEVAVETHRDELVRWTEPRRAAAKDHSPESFLSFHFESDRSIVEIHRHVVLQQGDLVDGGDVVDASLEFESRPVVC